MDECSRMLESYISDNGIRSQGRKYTTWSKKGVFQENFISKAGLVLVLKSRDKMSPSAYRPSCLLQILLKII